MPTFFRIQKINANTDLEKSIHLEEECKTVDMCVSYTRRTYVRRLFTIDQWQ